MTWYLRPRKTPSRVDAENESSELVDCGNIMCAYRYLKEETGKQERENRRHAAAKETDEKA